ncbi:MULTISPECIES: antitoxin [Streptomyces]|uniref:Antitoxin n=1 Tax=Streptomyces lonegramiae TaxID=3075524 RepID=A0ABU2XPK0_9ACTN|nr:antitoxin [Streptomyces sp. DSM 41529]MDT0546793.1 antitoxin [Streptomyces sp. DSM 41529]
MGIKDKLKEAINKGQERARHAPRKSGKGAADQPRSSAEKLDEEMRRRGGPPRGQ